MEIDKIITIKKNSSIYEGKVIYEDVNNITLKLNNGYYIGFDKKNIDIINIIIKEKKNSNTIKSKKYTKNKNLKNISFIATGGTISCNSGDSSEAVSPNLLIDDILNEFPIINKYANIQTKQVMNKLSENIIPNDWIILAKEIKNEIESGVDGIVVTCGTDTMVYIASSIAFMIETPIPIVFTGSQRSPDRPSSDNYMNLVCSLFTAMSDISEVTIVMHATTSDDYCYVHRAVKTKKMHTTKRSTFKSINTSPIAKVYFETGEIITLSKYIKRNEKKLNSIINIEEKCCLIKYHPGLDPKIIDYYINNNYKGIVLECVGMGHVSENWIEYIKNATNKNILVVITSQCNYGRVGCNVYQSGLKLLEAGAIEGGDLLPEVALVKTMWLLGFNNDINYIKSMINKNIRGDIETQEYE